MEGSQGFRWRTGGCRYLILFHRIENYFISVELSCLCPPSHFLHCFQAQRPPPFARRARMRWLLLTLCAEDGRAQLVRVCQTSSWIHIQTSTISVKTERVRIFPAIGKPPLRPSLTPPPSSYSRCHHCFGAGHWNRRVYYLPRTQPYYVTFHGNKNF
jgi:hypothetical protein